MRKNSETIYQTVPVKEGSENDPAPDLKPPPGLGVRHGQCLVLFLSLTTLMMTRAHISVTMVAMTDQSKPNFFKHPDDNVDNRTEIDIGNHTEVNITHTMSIESVEVATWSIYRTYNWTNSHQEMILFAFFVGYTSMNFFMGIIAQRIGGKIPVVFALFVNGITTIICPWLSLFGGWQALCAVRLLQGLTQAALYPSIHAMLGKWAPLAERGRLSTLIYCGSTVGVVVVYPIAGYLAGHPALGWMSTYWFCGSLCLVTCAMALWYGADSPYDHKSMTFEELTYIVGEGNTDVVPKKRRTPWKSIVTSKPVWGLMTTHAISTLGYNFLLTQVPTYMSHVLNVDIKHNGLFSSLPYIAMSVFTVLTGVIGDYCANRKLLKVINIRRIANTIGICGAGLCLVPFVYANTTWIAVLCLVCSMGIHSWVHIGFHINHIDLSPNFAGSLMALSNSIANLVSLINPVLVSTVLGDDLTNHTRWQILIAIILGIQTVGNAVFLVLVRVDVQPWNYSGEIDDDDTTKSKFTKMQNGNVEKKEDDCS